MIFCVGINYKSVDISIRESAYVDIIPLQSKISAAIKKYSISEAFGLSTCNRSEIYGVFDESHSETLQQELKEKLFESIFLDVFSSDKFDREISGIYVHFNQEASRHAFEVVASLDSLVVGETQITGQFKQAFSSAKEQGTIGPILTRMCQESFAVSKKIRTQTKIGSETTSIGHTAVKLAIKVFGPLENANVMCIGAGEMALVTTKYLAKYNPKQLTLINRTLANAEKISAELSDYYNCKIKVDLLDHVLQHLANVDLIFCATSSHSFLLTREMLDPQMNVRGHKSLTILDLSLPRNVDPKCAEIEDLYLFDIDDLKQSIDNNIQNREKYLIEAREYVEHAVQQFNVWLEHLKLSASFEKVYTYISSLTQQELEKTLSKKLFTDLSPDRRKSLHEMMESVSRKFAADTASHFKTSSLPQQEKVSFINELFAKKSSSSFRESI